MEETIPAKVLNRRTRDERLGLFESLADFANLGDSPDDWRGFRSKHPQFFPAMLTEWIYSAAEIWAQKRTRREFRKPLLLLYRDALREVWLQDDGSGFSLNFLLGIDPVRARRDLSVALFSEVEPPLPKGCTWEEMLPHGMSRVDGVKTEIVWEFGWTFQRAVYDLMQDRWRAMVCPRCKKCFVADKTAQKYCSPRCYGEKRQEQMSRYYYRKGRVDRARRKAKQATSRRRKEQ